MSTATHSTRPRTRRSEAIGFIPCPTPHGDMLAAFSDQGLCRLLAPGMTPGELERWTDRHAPGAYLHPLDDTPHGLDAQLTAYFDGDGRAFDLPLDLRGTPFQTAVWEAVLAIPYGETRSYIDIARTVGRPDAPRAVGAANAINPLAVVVPCHRVVGADGSLKGYVGGILNRRMLLQLEGVV